MILADLQIHSRYSRACSKYITIDNLEKWAKVKGIDLLSTGDFQHPLWRKEINEKLEEDDNGILWTKDKFPFLWGTEISLMYSQGGKGRRIHHLIFSPNGEVADQITEVLGSKGRLDYDGRPIFGFTSIELVEMMREINKDIEIVPAHAWTPWFGLFGSKSGFDSLKECFQEKSKHIHAIETGMSSDPEMNRRLSQLDNINLVSFSDAHSFWPWRLGREATIFNTKLDAKEILSSIKTGDNLSETIETNPSYGKYHFDGHRKCNITMNPRESMKINNICPVCKRELTLGVLHRVEELADRDKGDVDKPFKKLIPLTELIAKFLDIKQLGSKGVWNTYNPLIKEFNSEFNVLLNVKEEELSKIVHARLANIIIRNRESKLEIKPGYDSTYGEVVLKDEEKLAKQKSLSEY